MSVTDTAITLAAILEWEAPGGTVRLCDGGVVKYDTGAGIVTFESEHPVWGTVIDFGAFEGGIGDMVEGGEIVFAPNPAATLSDWWRDDLENTRLRVWQGEIASDGVTLENEELLADWLVDTATRTRGQDGEELMQVECMTRLHKLFQIRDGNTCSDRFHRSIWTGERGFENCHDGPQYFAWGTEGPSGAGSSGGAQGGGGRGGPVDQFER